MDVGLVCDSCRTFNPMGAPSCSQCDGTLALEPNGKHSGTTDASAADPGVVSAAPNGAAASSSVTNCPACGESVENKHRFCSACGCVISVPNPSEFARARDGSGKGSPRTTMLFSAMQKARPKLVLIRGDGVDGLSYSLAGEDHLAGRGDVPLAFPQDPYLSPEHANFIYRDGKLFVRDQDSANGVFLRIRGSVEIQFGDKFLIGEQLLAVEMPVQAEFSGARPDGTYAFSSPNQILSMKVVQLLRGGDTGFIYAVDTPSAVIGRSGNTINFPDDPFISGRHAEITYESEVLRLTDLDSKNGTFICVRNEKQLAHGDYVFLGQQLLRVEIV